MYIILLSLDLRVDYCSEDEQYAIYTLRKKNSKQRNEFKKKIVSYIYNFIEHQNEREIFK